MQYYLFDSHYGKFDRYFSAFVCETIKHECLQSKYELKKQSNSKAVQNIHFTSNKTILIVKMLSGNYSSSRHLICIKHIHYVHLYVA